MTHRGRRSLAAVLAVGLLAASWAAPARAQSDFVEYYYNAGVDAHFYYSPSSITRAVVGNALLVKWTDSRPKGSERLIFLVLVDCSGRTSKMLSVDRVDYASGAFIATVDLRDKSTDDPATPGTMGGYLLEKVC
ncbi:MAG: hypothetical protein JWP35_451 [Caulobacter sp.]|nr:hypothetical protein [Caulobacter sp.]